MVANSEKDNKMEVTKLSDIANFKKKDGAVVELPALDEDTHLIVKLKRPSLMDLCTAGIIPNTLLGVVQEIYDGDIKGDIKSYYEVLKIIAEQALVEPKYEDIKDILTDQQLIFIFQYVQLGVIALYSFRQDFQLQKAINTMLQGKGKTFDNPKGKG